MADRTDIDALLIGALYGELTPADEARLTAHLESHPADRTALDDLTRTRAAVRDSRILAFHFEPPAAVSALLLQEASRRAPRVQDREESWFQRFVRSFAAHPAMAAAATIVLVLGVAGTLYLRGVRQFAETAPPVGAVAPQADTVSQSEAENKAATVSTTGAGGQAADPAADRPAPAAEPVAVPAVPAEQLAAPTGGAAAGSAGVGGVGTGSYRVDLDSTTGRKAPAAPAIAREGDLVGKDQADGAAEGRATGGFKVGAKGEGERAKSATPGKAKLEKLETAKLRGIEVRRPEPMPKELKDSDDEFGQRGAITKFNNDRAGAAGSTERAQRAVAPAGPAGAAAVTTPSPAPPPPAPEQAPVPPMTAAPAPRSSVSDAKRAVKSAPPSSAASQVPAKPPANQATADNQPSVNQASNSRAPATKTPVAGNANDRSADKADAKPADEKTARDAALLAWARKQRDQVVSLVTANNCDAAADAAMEIYNRAPGYFSSVILTDREVRPCLPYVTRQRDRAERSRAAKNANSATDQAPSRK